MRNIASLNSLLKFSFQLFLYLFLSTTFLFGQERKPTGKLDFAFNQLWIHPLQEDARINKNKPTFLTLAELPISSGIQSENIESVFDCIIYTSDIDLLKSLGVKIRSQYADFVTAGITLSQLEKLVESPTIRRIENPLPRTAFNDISVTESGANLLHSGALNNTAYTGKNVIVAVYDTGIDFTHPDFRDPNDPSKSRILYLWDQTLTPINGESSPAGFDYGVLYTQSQINAELTGSPVGFVREQDTNGHGTHVTATAAGNGSALISRKHKGMAPEADLIIIKGGNGTFSESRMIDGISFVQQMADNLGKPVVLNMSIGGQLSAHDGSRNDEKALDVFTNSAPGRVAVLAAGNSGEQKIHVEKTITPFTTETLSVSVPNKILHPVNDPDAFLIYSTFGEANVEATITVETPHGGLYTINTNPSVFQSNEYFIGDSLKLYFEVGEDPANDKTSFLVYISRETQNGAQQGNPIGDWKIHVTNNTSGVKKLHAWLAHRANYGGTLIFQNANSEYLVTSPANASSAIAVGNYTARNSWFSNYASGSSSSYALPTQKDSINPSSSVGPRIDGVIKPEIVAPGKSTVSAYSKNSPNQTGGFVYTNLYSVKVGTSMASPVVAGAAALLLQAKPTANSSEIKTLLINAARKDFFTEMVPTPNPVYGYGKLDVYTAAAALFNCEPVQRIFQAYDTKVHNQNESTINLANKKMAVEFTAELDGFLEGFYVYSGNEVTVPLKVEIRNEEFNNPGSTILGQKVFDSASNNYARYTWNYIPLSDLKIPLVVGQKYFIVIYPESPSASWSIVTDSTKLSSSTRIFESGSWMMSNLTPRIRSVEFVSPQQTANNLVSNYASISQSIYSNNLFRDECEIVSSVSPTGSNPVAGTVTSKVWVETTLPTNNVLPFVQRHYEIKPAINPESVSGRVTLYFLQSEFDEYNSSPLAIKKLPMNSLDWVNRENIRIEKIAGSSNDLSGMPDTYDNDSEIIIPDPENIYWNEPAQRWEISFLVEGFSGFFLHSFDISILPIKLEFFSGESLRSTNFLKWKVNCYEESGRFELQRSANGTDFSPIHAVQADLYSCSREYSFVDQTFKSAKNYYRLKVIEEGSGREYYSSIVMLESIIAANVQVYPTVLSKNEKLNISISEISTANLKIMDITGRNIFQTQLRNGFQSINLPSMANGAYFYYIILPNGKVYKSGNLIVQ